MAHVLEHLVPQLVLMFGKVVESLSRRVLLEEVCGWGMNLRL